MTIGAFAPATMIALPGLALVTGRAEIAKEILLAFASFVDRGMLPNNFPDAGGTPEYNTIDATLWYFEAIRQYFAATEDVATLNKLFPILAEIVEAHDVQLAPRLPPAPGFFRPIENLDAWGSIPRDGLVRICFFTRVANK